MDMTTLGIALKLFDSKIKTVDDSIADINTALEALKLPKKINNISASSDCTYTFASASGNIIVTMGAGTGQMSILNVFAGSSAITIGDISKGANVTYTKSGLDLTIANGVSGNALYVCVINLWGNEPVIKEVNE